MGLTSHLPYVYVVFSSYHVSFSLMTSLTIKVLGPGHLVRALFNFPLRILLVVSVDYFHLVQSMEYFHLVESFEYFDLVKSNLVESNIVEFNPVKSIQYFHLV